MKKNLMPQDIDLICLRILPIFISSCFSWGSVYANPVGAQIVNGQVNIASKENVLTVINTPGAIINWQSFSINSGQITQFLQQNSSSSVLNRIVGQNPSQIFGTLKSNGKVYLINPNGILFGPDSQVNVSGLIASSLGISNADFLSGKNNFNGSSTSSGSVVNQGSITTPAGGNIYLIAPQVQNSGILNSPQGEILLAAGHSVQLVDGADPNIQVVISAPTDQAINLGQVIAQGGKIGVLGALVNQNGIANANSAVVGQNGSIVFKSSQTTMLSQNSQTSAVGSGQSNSGGTIEVLGPQVGIIDNALVNASGQSGGGKVLIGGDFHGANASIENANAVFIGPNAQIKADAINAGNGGNIAVWSDGVTRMYGNISGVGGAQSGNGGYVETSSKNYLDFRGQVNVKSATGHDGTLLLDPYDIVIDSSNTYSGSISCTGCSGSATVNFSNPGPTTPSILGAAYLTSQLATGDVTVSTLAAGGGIYVNSMINWTSGHMLSLSAVGDININANINGLSGGGNLAIRSTAGNITEYNGAYVQAAQLSLVATAGNVNLNNYENFASVIAGSASGSFQFNGGNAVTVGTANGISGIAAGGDIALTSFYSSINTVNASIAGPSLTLVASSGIGAKTNPLNTNVGSLNASNGGGDSSPGRDIVISNTGQPLTVTGITQVASSNPGEIIVISDNAMNINGALANNNGNANSNITMVSSGSMSLNTASTSGPSGAINLYAGYNETIGLIPAPNYSLSTLTQLGSLTGTAINLYANRYADFLGSPTYSISPTYFPGPIPFTVYLNGETATSKTYDGTTNVTLSGGTLNGVPAAFMAGVSLTQGGNFLSRNVGTGIGITANDVLNVAPGLAGNFAFVQTTGLTASISPATLSIAGQSAANKTYDGTTVATLTGGTLVGLVTGDALNLAQSGNFSTANAGKNIAVAANNSITGSTSSNYTLVQPTGLTASITPATLSVVGEIAQNKIYDGTMNATLTGGTLSGTVAGDINALSLIQSGNFVGSNISNGIAVTATDSITGSASSNYALGQPTGLFANIIGPTITTQSTPMILASNSYIIALNTESSNLFNGGLSTLNTAANSGANIGSSGASGSGTNNSGATNNGNVKKLYCN